MSLHGDTGDGRTEEREGVKGGEEGEEVCGWGFGEEMESEVETGERTASDEEPAGEKARGHLGEEEKGSHES